jgi:ABC-type lipoprotein release transport system permease subunit
MNMIALAFLVSNTLISNLIKDKTYENAMLRTLGWNQSHIVFILSIKTILFFVLPGAVGGLMVAYFMSGQIESILAEETKR